MSKKYIDITLSPNLEQTNLLMAGLDALPDEKKSQVTYQRLYKQLETIRTIWNRRKKNEKQIEVKSNEKSRNSR